MVNAVAGPQRIGIAPAIVVNVAADNLEIIGAIAKAIMVSWRILDFTVLQANVIDAPLVGFKLDGARRIGGVKDQSLKDDVLVMGAGGIAGQGNGGVGPRRRLDHWDFPRTGGDRHRFIP